MTRDVRPRVRSLGYQPALDGLRGVAVAFVMLYHQGGTLTGGYLGVDVFFVLSGFLITGILVSERATTGRLRLVAFWGRRARRLVPALLVMLVLVAILGRYAYPDRVRSLIRTDVPYVLGYVQNWHLMWSSRTTAT